MICLITPTLFVSFSLESDLGALNVVLGAAVNVRLYD